MIDHVILVKCTSHCLSVAQFAQPNLEIGQNSNSTSLNICETFSKMTDFEMPSWSKRKPEEAPQGQGRRAVRQAVAEGRNDRDVTGGRAGDSVSGRRIWFQARRAWPKQWQRQVDSASPKQSAQTLKSSSVHRACMCSLAATRGLAPEHVAVLKSYWESNVVKSAQVQLAAHVRHCRAKPCKKIEGKEGWTRIVFCVDPVTQKDGPAPRSPLEQQASRLLIQMRGKHGVLEPSMVYAFLMTKGGQQVPLAKSKAKARARNRATTNEGAEQTPDVSPPRPTPERPSHSVREGRNAGTLDCLPKIANITEKPTAKRRGDLWGNCKRMTTFSPTWNQLHVS